MNTGEHGSRIKALLIELNTFFCYRFFNYLLPFLFPVAFIRVDLYSRRCEWLPQKEKEPRGGIGGSTVSMLRLRLRNERANSAESNRSPYCWNRPR